MKYSWICTVLLADRRLYLQCKKQFPVVILLAAEEPLPDLLLIYKFFRRALCLENDFNHTKTGDSMFSQILVSGRFSYDFVYGIVVCPVCFLCTRPIYMKMTGLSVSFERLRTSVRLDGVHTVYVHTPQGCAGTVSHIRATDRLEQAHVRCELSCSRPTEQKKKQIPIINPQWCRCSGTPCGAHRME